MSAPESSMNGARWLMDSAAASGIEVCFANPGTTELPIVSALDDVPRMRPILCLFEGVCSGAADGYYRIARRPAMTLTHLGPGYANALANLHNARRARSSMLNLVGDHMSWHLLADPPLASDIRALAGTVSTGGVWQPQSLDELQADGRAALQSAVSEEGIGTFIMPMDVQLAPCRSPVAGLSPGPRLAAPMDAAAFGAVVDALRTGRKTLLMLGSSALDEASLHQVSRLTTLAHVQVMGETFPARSEHGRGLPAVHRMFSLAREADAFLCSFECVALLGLPPPVAFFAEAGVPSHLGRPETLHMLAPIGGRPCLALQELADALRLPRHVQVPEVPPLDDSLLGNELTAESAAAVLAAHLPDDAITTAEGSTLGFPFNRLAAQAARHSTIVLTGGAIGQGLPSALGASIAAPRRRVVALQSDGSAMYTVQALWSMARESADVTIVIASNQRYQVLLREMRRTGLEPRQPSVRRLMALDAPSLDWVSMARSMGVPATKAASTPELRHAFKASIATPGPHLIEAVLP